MSRRFPSIGKILATAALLAAATAAARDPWLWPFAATSIWNTAIGSRAAYVPAGLGSVGYVGVDIERHIRLTSNDPVRPVCPPSSWEKRWPGDRSRKLGEMPVPDSLIIPDAKPPNTPNECAAFLMPDGRTLKQLEPACRVEAGAHIVGWLREDVDLYGDGIKGTHWGSGLSSLGGTIRRGELVSGRPIRHALKINLWGKKYLFYSRENPGFRWPADRADASAAQTYGGRNPKLVMGALLAIRPDVKIEDLNLVSAPAQRIFKALQDYGAYVVDDSGWDAADLCVEQGVPEEVREANEVEMSSRDSGFFSDLNKILPLLHIVDNNSPAAIGGGGKPRQPPAPEIEPGQ